MSCLLILILAMFPRTLLAIWWFIGYAQNQPSLLWNILGFLFMPTTLAAWIYTNITNSGEFTGGYLILLIVAIVFDLSSHASSSSTVKSKEKS